MDDALIATIKYLKERRGTGIRDYEKEEAISLLWLEASRKIADFDPDMANAAYYKGLGWSDDSIWLYASRNGIKISITDMQKARQTLTQVQFREGNMDRVPSWFPVAGAVFLAITIAFFMYVYISPPPVTGQPIVLTALTSFCAAASFTFFGGQAAAGGSIPYFKDAPIKFSVGGGVAVFIIVFALMRLA
ncbi:MAG: hypothetical protein E5V89_01875 [Mesorhizobium sp.]|nr:MAG: hypothetical protein E5V89_01875 [Mesorhizobium sp.]